MNIKAESLLDKPDFVRREDNSFAIESPEFTNTDSRESDGIKTEPMDQIPDTGAVSGDEVGPQGEDRKFDEDQPEDGNDETGMDAEYEDRGADDSVMSPDRSGLDNPNDVSAMSEDKGEVDEQEKKPQTVSETHQEPPTTMEGCKTRIYELEQDISFLKQSITSVYQVFRCFNNLILDIDMNSVPDLVYFMEKLADHLKESDTIKSKAEGLGSKLGNNSDTDREELERQIYDVVENCNTCQGVVSKINMLITKFREDKRKLEFSLGGLASKLMRAGSTTDSLFDYMPELPQLTKEGEANDGQTGDTNNSYFGLPTVHGEDGQEEVVYTGQDFDMDQYLKQSGVKRKRPSKYNCGACGKVFNKLKYVKSHYNHQHVVQKKLFCGVCGLSFSYKSNLTRHLRLIHMEERKEKCPECDESFGTRMQLDSHLRKFHEAPKLHCNDCGQTFIQEQSLRNHGEVCPANDHQVKVMCGICGKSFAAKRYLQNHIRAKHTDRVSPHVCDICSKTFSGQFALKRHRVKKHRDEVENLAIKGESEYNFDIRDNKPGKVKDGDDDESAEEGEEKKSQGQVNGSGKQSTPGNKKTPKSEGKQPAKKAKKEGGTGSKTNNSTPKTPNGNKTKSSKASKAKTNSSLNKSNESEKSFEIISRNVDYDNLLINQEVGGLTTDDDDRMKFIGAINLQERPNSGSPDTQKKDSAMYPMEDGNLADSADNSDGMKKQNKRKRSLVKRQSITKEKVEEIPSPSVNKSGNNDNLVYYDGRLWENNPNGAPVPRPFTYTVEGSVVEDRFRIESTSQQGPAGFNTDSDYNSEMRANMANSSEMRANMANSSEMRANMANSNEKAGRNMINFPQVGAGSPSALKDSQENHMRPPSNLIHYNSGNMMSGDMNNMGANLSPNLQSSLDPRAFEQLRRLTSGSMPGFGMNSGIRQNMGSGNYPGMMSNMGQNQSPYNRPEMDPRYYGNTGAHMSMMSSPPFSGAPHMSSNRHERSPDNM